MSAPVLAVGFALLVLVAAMVYMVVRVRAALLHEGEYEPETPAQRQIRSIGDAAAEQTRAFRDELEMMRRGPKQGQGQDRNREVRR